MFFRYKDESRHFHETFSWKCLLSSLYRKNMWPWKGENNVTFLFWARLIRTLGSRTVCPLDVVLSGFHCIWLSVGFSWLFFSRLALRQKRGDMSYEERCDTLHWPSLSSRRTYSSLVECYKIVFGLSHLDFEEFFQFAKVKSTRANHSYKLYCKLSRINCFKYSFFNNVISYWNNLPSNVVEAGSLELFKCKLKSFLKL